jgi:hypothetical protein
MGNPAFRQNQRKNSGIYLGPTRGKSSPKNSRMGCLCLNSDTYSTKCCNGALQQQGIGQTQGPVVQRGAFNAGFSSGFDIGNI